MSIFAELQSEVGPPLATADLLPQVGPMVMALEVDVPADLGGPKRLVVGKCLGSGESMEDLAISPVGQMVLARITEGTPPETPFLVMQLDTRETVRARVIEALSMMEPPAIILFVTKDERILGQLSWLLGVGNARLMGMPAKGTA